MSEPFSLERPRQPTNGSDEAIIKEIETCLQDTQYPSPGQTERWIREGGPQVLSQLCRSFHQLYPRKRLEVGQLAYKLRQKIEASLDQRNLLWSLTFDEYVCEGLVECETEWIPDPEKQLEGRLSVAERLNKLLEWAQNQNGEQIEKLLAFQTPQLWEWIARKAPVDSTLLARLLTDHPEKPSPDLQQDRWSKQEVWGDEADIRRQIRRQVAQNPTLQAEHIAQAADLLEDSRALTTLRHLFCHPNCSTKNVVGLLDKYPDLIWGAIPNLLDAPVVKNNPECELIIAQHTSHWAELERLLSDDRLQNPGSCGRFAAINWGDHFLEMLQEKPHLQDKFQEGLTYLLAEGNPEHRKQALRLSQHNQTQTPDEERGKERSGRR